MRWSAPGVFVAMAFAALLLAPPHAGGAPAAETANAEVYQLEVTVAGDDWSASAVLDVDDPDGDGMAFWDVSDDGLHAIVALFGTTVFEFPGTYTAYATYDGEDYTISGTSEDTFVLVFH
jgi:hypothetical protein